MRQSRGKDQQVTRPPCTKTRAVGYIRVSSKEQQEEGFSLDAQIGLLKDYASKKNMDLVHIFMDVQTAKTPGRKDFEAMVAFFRKQSKLPPSNEKCLTALVEKTDRFYRNATDMVAIRDVGATTHLIKEGMVIGPNSSCHEKFVHGMNVIMAERVVDNLSEETKKGMLEKAQQGIWPSFAPMGYFNIKGPNKKRIIVQDQTLAPLVRKVFEKYATGLFSLKDICLEAKNIGLVHRNSGNQMTKSALYDLLTNPIYYGDFYWKGLLYQGNHEPIITKELFDKVQRMFDRRSSCPTGRQTHDFLFQGMLTCGFCGCALVAEIQKGKYIYYHCTGNRGKCPGRYAREELIEDQFVSILRRIHIDDDVLGWIVSVLNSSSAQDKELRAAQLRAMTEQRNRLEGRLDRIYMDRLDEVIDEEEYKRLSNKFRIELSNLKERIGQLAEEKPDSIANAARLLELAQKAASLYSTQDKAEKRKLLNFVCSNSKWESGELLPEFNKPFDLLIVTNDEYQQKKVTSPEKSDLSEFWRPLPDLNRRRRRERAVSWAGLDEGDSVGKW